MHTCIIVAAMGTSCTFQKAQGDIVIAADAGYRTLQAAGIAPDLLVGDFDSLGDVPDVGCEVIRHPVMKDDTDTMLAVKLGLARGYREFCIYGGMGGRTDHTVANIQALAYIAARGGHGYLVGGDESMTVFQNGTMRFRGGRTGTISVFAYGGPARGVTLTGLLYPLKEAVLTADFPLGVSNVFTGDTAAVQVGEGTALVIWSGAFDREEFLWLPYPPAEETGA